MATYYNNGYSWYIQWTENSERKKRKIGKIGKVTEADARLAAKAKEIELHTGRIVISTGVIFQNFVEQYKEWHKMEYPSSHFRVEQIIDKHLKAAFNYIPLDGITPVSVEQYKINRMKKVKSATVAKELRTLKAIINKAVEWELIQRNPIAYVKPPQNLDSKPPRFYTAEEVPLLYAHNQRQHWWRFMVNTGLRRGEALQITRNDIAADALRVKSTSEARTKSGKWREIPLNIAAMDALQELGKDTLIPRMVPRSLSRHFEHDSVAVGGSIHCLRHTYCAHLVMAGVPLRTVQKLAGHASFVTTEKYAHLAPDYLKREAGLINL